MRTDIKKLHAVWDNAMVTRKDVPLDKNRFDTLMASIFCPGPFYFYVVDFYDREIKYMHPNIKAVLGHDPENVTFNDIIASIHPDDMDHVASAENKLLKLLYEQFGKEKVLKYKMGYCFRFRTADGSYQLFQHQAVLLTLDDQGGFSKSLNIHTNINHLTTQNNFKASLIGLEGEPSLLGIDVHGNDLPNPPKSHNFSKRELEILKLISEGLNSKMIGERLNISTETVTTHRRNILSKSNAPNTTKLIATLIQEGLL